MTAASLGRPRFITLDDAMAFHAVSIAQYGGSEGIRDVGLLESALAQAQQGFGGQFTHEFPFGMASAYAFHVAKNHPFFDGNKRTALLCCGAFLRMNGWNLTSAGTDAADAILELIEGKHTKASFAEWLEKHSIARVSFELRDFFFAFGPALFEAWKSPQESNEFESSLAEAARSIPLIEDFVRQRDAWRSKGDESIAQAYEAQLTLMTRIYRIAEDMGYEW